jgi:hypothetical protein
MSFIFRLVRLLPDFQAIARGRYPQRLARRSIIRRVNKYIR